MGEFYKETAGVKTAIYPPKAAGTDTHLSANAVYQGLGHNFRIADYYRTGVAHSDNRKFRLP
jgi:hypothetical protein